MKKDAIHKQIMKTKNAFVNDENFDPEEALEAAVDKRKFLMKRLFAGDTRSQNSYTVYSYIKRAIYLFCDTVKQSTCS